MSVHIGIKGSSCIQLSPKDFEINCILQAGMVEKQVGLTSRVYKEPPVDTSH